MTQSKTKQPEDMKTRECQFCNKKAVLNKRFKPSPEYPLAYDLCDSCAKEHKEAYLSLGVKTNTRGWEPGFGKLKATYYLADKKEYVQEQLNLEESEEEVLKSFIKKVEDTTRTETIREVEEKIDNEDNMIEILSEWIRQTPTSGFEADWGRSLNKKARFMIEQLTTLLNQVKK